MNEKENKLQKQCDEFVRHEVLQCQSSLVELLLKKEIFQLDDIENLYMSDEQLSDYGIAESKEDIDNIRDNGEDMQDVLEWWLCTDWLIKKLRDRGEPILNTDYGSWWGRTCSGQAILLDGVIKDIVTEK